MSLELTRAVSRLPAVDIPYPNACRNYGGAVAKILDDLSHSKSTVRDADPKGFKWQIAFQRAEDPPSVSDHAAFYSYLAANSKIYLKATARATGHGGGAWMGVEELFIVPPQIQAKFEQHARLICAQRKAEKEREQEPELVPTPEPANGDGIDLEGWLESHPEHDKRLASIARSVLHHLMQSAE